MSRRGSGAALLLTAVLGAAPAGAETVLVKGATVWTQGPQGTITGADLLVRDGKIVRVGKGLDAPSGARVIDGTGKHVTPGLIDCHSHTAIRGGVNEGSNNITSEVRIDDVIDPRDVALYRELAGGLTAAHLLHGSANSIGGQDAVVKLHYRTTRDRMLIAGAAPGIKFALGENPKQSNFRDANRTPRYPATRMGVMESIRERFTAARHYREAWDAYDHVSASAKERREPPRRDLQLEAIAEILAGKRTIHSHCYRQDEILALIRTAEAFGVKIGTFQHVLEGYKVADEIAAHGAGGSTFSDWWAYKLEAYDAIPFNGALMRERGVLVTFNSDSDELARRLNLEAAKAVKYGGVPESAALDFVTLNAAKQLGISGKTGSLEPGKDADFVIWSGSPLSTLSFAEQTWVDGVCEFDRAKDLVERAALAKARAEAVAKIRGDAKADTKSTDESPAAPRTIPPPTPARYVDRLATSGPTVSIVHATVHTVSGGVLTDGTISFRAGRIVEVGAGLPPLAGATVVDASGKHAWPGLVDANTAIGLTEIGSVSGSVDIAETGSLNPDVNTSIAVNPDSEIIPVTRANGVTHVLSAPEGGLVSGTSSLIRLSGWTWEDVTAASPMAMHLSWPSFRIRRGPSRGTQVSEEDQKKDRDEALKKIKQLFENAAAYAKAKSTGGTPGRPFDRDPALEAMQAVLEGRIPIIVQASEIKQIRSAVAFAETQGVRMILLAAGDVALAADLLRSKDIPVIVDGILAVPGHEDDAYDEAYAIPAKLKAAGVRFCISSGGGGFGAANTRNLPYHAAMAAAFGLTPDDALRAITLEPARILGVGNEIGSIENGKSASLILTDGDPLEIRTHVLAEWIDGRPVALDENRHTRLYRKYAARPGGASTQSAAIEKVASP